MSKKFKIVKITENVNFPNGRREQYFEGNIDYLNSIFSELFKMGRIHNDKIKASYKTAKGIVGGLNKVSYEFRDYFTEYKLIG